MGKINILNKKKVAIKAVSGGIIVPPAIDFVIDVELPSEIEKEAAKDKLLVKKFGDQAKDILEMTVKMVEDKIKVFENLFKGMLEKGEKPSVVIANLNGLNKALQQDFDVAKIAAEQGCMKVWQELQEHKKEWKKFKIKVGVSIAGTLATLAVSIAAMASSPWTGGAGAAFAIIGFIKSGVKIAQDIKRIAIDFDGALKELEGHLKVVEATANNKGLYTLNEVTAAVVTEFLGIAQPSIKSAGACADTLKAKYAQMVVNSHALSKEISKIEAQQEKLTSELFKEAATKMKGLPPSAVAANLKKMQANYGKKMDALDKEIKKKEAEVDRLYEKTKAMAPKVKEVLGRVEELKLKDPKGLKVFREALKFAVLGLAPLNGNGIAESAQDLGMGLGNALGGYAYDKITSLATDGTVLDAA